MERILQHHVKCDVAVEVIQGHAVLIQWKNEFHIPTLLTIKDRRPYTAYIQMEEI